MNSWEFHHCSSEAICSKFLTRMVLRSPTKHQGGPYLPPLLIYSTDPSALDHHLDHTLPRTTVQSYPPHFETDMKWSISQRATFSTYPPPTKKNTARNHAGSDFYHFCLLNAHQITSPFMHIISNYILGVSGGNGIQEALRIAIGPFLSLHLFSFLLFLNGVWLYLLFLVFPFLGCLIIVLWFLDVFASFVHFLCTGLCSFNKLLNYLSKTNKKTISLFLGSFIPHIFREMILISLILLKKPYHLPIF